MAPTRLISSRIAHAAILLTGMGFAVPAAAEDVNQIGIYGEVAPRCWAATPAPTARNATPSLAGGHAICNQAQPVLVAELRAIGPDGALMARVPAKSVPLSTRTALEIVVTPRP